jgi:hypothetical protein
VVLAAHHVNDIPADEAFRAETDQAGEKKWSKSRPATDAASTSSCQTLRISRHAVMGVCSVSASSQNSGFMFDPVICGAARPLYENYCAPNFPKIITGQTLSSDLSP